jgi:hypothetical protein
MAALQYSVAKILYPTFAEAKSLAESAPQLDFDPNPKMINQNPAKHYFQGIFRATLERIVNGLIDDGRIISMEEFDKRFGNDWRTPLPEEDESRPVDVHEVFRIFSTRIKHFHPKRKPVLWRIILAQLVLYQALERMQDRKSVV